MKLELQHRWIKATDFGLVNPLHCKVISFWMLKKARGDDFIIEFLAENTLDACMSLWGTNMNECIKTWGDNPDKWIGKQFSLLQEDRNGSSCRLITPLN